MWSERGRLVRVEVKKDYLGQTAGVSLVIAIDCRVGSRVRRISSAGVLAEMTEIAEARSCSLVLRSTTGFV